MTTAPQNRVHAGVPDGGQFARTNHSDNVPVLGAPTVSTEFVSHRLDEAGFSAHLSDAEIERVTAELNASRDFRDENITAVADQVHLDTAGHTVTDAIAADEGLAALTRLGREDWVAALRRVQGRQPERTEVQWPGDMSGSISGEMLRNAVGQMQALPDGKTAPVQENDPRLQAGEVFDKVQAPDRTIFHRRRDGVFPDEPGAFRIQANRPLTKAEKQQMAGLIGYAYRATVRGESLSDPYSDSPYSFIIGADTTKSQSDDLGMALERFEESLEDMIQNGSPVRTTNRSGPDTAGTRLVEGFNDPGLKFELYYDDVVEA